MMSEPMSDEDNEDRDRMISQAMSLLLASSRVNHILHDAVMEVDKEMSRLRAENERLRQSVAGERMFKESERQWKKWANEAGAKVTQELEAMKAEVERLREVLRDIAYNTSTSIPFAAPPETYIVGQLHSCIGRAARALNPEPSA